MESTRYAIHWMNISSDAARSVIGQAGRMTTIEKPRVRVPARSADSFANFQARLCVGQGATNFSDGSTYKSNPISRNRGSWLVGQAVDIVAEDMTRAGIEITTSLPPDDKAAINSGLERLCIWQAINDTIKWSRLYGGSIAVLIIDGQNVSTPLKSEIISRGQFKGLMVLDR